ncbi:MAG: hypothetical protein ACJ71S_00490 [Acidobacteriaceae bacterium]
MQKHAYAAALSAALLLPALMLAKDKQKSTLPTYVLQAHTVSIVIDRDAGVSLENPQANQVAQRDVETALLNWGRYQPILDGSNADLIIFVRRGTGKLASGTVHDPRQGRRPVSIDPTDTGIDAGAQRGHAPPYAGDLPDASQGSVNGPLGGPLNDPTDRSPHPQAEIGNSAAEDSFIVYQGKIDNPTDAPPVWRYQAKNALKPHTVPAVDVFRKAVDAAEQAAAKQP